MAAAAGAGMVAGCHGYQGLIQPPYATWCSQSEKAGLWCPRLEMELWPQFSEK